MLDIVEDAVDKVMSELDGQKMFNGIDNEVMEEIRESLIDILFKKFS